MNSYEIRQANDQDLPGAAQMRWNWIITERGGVPAADYGEFESCYVQWANDNASTHTCYVIERGGDLIGMAWVAYLARVPSPRDFNRKTADLQSVYVMPEARDAGLGSQLIEYITQQAFAAGVERVQVHSTHQAIPAYERAGFETKDFLRQRQPPVLDVT